MRPIPYAILRAAILPLLCGIALLAPAVHAGMISTDKLIAPAQSAAERARVEAILSRPEASRQLQMLGVPAMDAQARVDAMSDEEIHRIAGRLDTLPAGGNFTDYQVIVIVLLVILVALAL